MSEIVDIFCQDHELRSKNLETVKKYMAMTGSRLNRHKLFTDDCTSGLAYSETGGSMYVTGIENVAKMDEWNTRCFPDWKWENVKIYQTQDPNYFWVECDGSGKHGFWIIHRLNIPLILYTLLKWKMEKSRLIVNFLIR